MENTVLDSSRSLYGQKEIGLSLSFNQFVLQRGRECKMMLSPETT